MFSNTFLIPSNKSFIILTIIRKFNNQNLQTHNKFSKSNDQTEPLFL